MTLAHKLSEFVLNSIGGRLELETLQMQYKCLSGNLQKALANIEHLELLRVAHNINLSGQLHFNISTKSGFIVNLRFLHNSKSFVIK